MLSLDKSTASWLGFKEAHLAFICLLPRGFPGFYLHPAGPDPRCSVQLSLFQQIFKERRFDTILHLSWVSTLPQLLWEWQMFCPSPKLSYLCSQFQLSLTLAQRPKTRWHPFSGGEIMRAQASCDTHGLDTGLDFIHSSTCIPKMEIILPLYFLYCDKSLGGRKQAKMSQSLKFQTERENNCVLHCFSSSLFSQPLWSRVTHFFTGTGWCSVAAADRMTSF